MGTGRILLLAALFGLAFGVARPAGAAIVTLIEDNDNEVDQPGNLGDRVSADIEWANLNEVEFSIELQNRDDQGVLGLASLNLNDTNEDWFNFTLELVGALWSAPSLDAIQALDDEGLIRGGLSLELTGMGSYLTISFDPELTDRSTLELGNTATPIFDLLNDLLIDISDLETGASFGLFLQPNRDAGPRNGGGGGISIPAPPAFALGLVCMVMGAAKRRIRKRLV